MAANNEEQLFEKQKTAIKSELNDPAKEIPALFVVYKVTCTKAYMIEEQGESFSLSPWNGDTNKRGWQQLYTDYYDGYDDGGREYLLPHGFKLDEFANGSFGIFDAADNYYRLSSVDNNTPILVGSDKIIYIQSLENAEKLKQEEQKRKIDAVAIEQEVSSEKTLSELHINKIMDERRMDIADVRVSDADLQSAKVAAQTIINNENLMKGSMGNEGHEQAAVDAAKASKSFLDNARSGSSFSSELSHIRREAGSSVEIKEAEVNRYYGPGQLKVYEKTAILTLSRSQKIAYDVKDLRGQYPSGTDIKVRGMKLLAEDKGISIITAEHEKEGNQR